MQLTSFFKNFLADDEGAAAIEYALIAALIALGLVVGAQALGTELSGFFQSIATYLNGLRP